MGELLKYSVKRTWQIPANIYTNDLSTREIPEKWISYKKGNKKDKRNYRPTSLLPVVYKIFAKIISYSIQNTLDVAPLSEQADLGVVSAK